jgi:hypothetical protein
MECTLETTTFRGDDDPRLVSAALACSACLSSDVDWSLGLDEWDARVECSCRSCGHRRVLALNPQQALRLSLAA